MKSFTLPVTSDPEVVELFLDSAADLDGVAGVVMMDGYAVVRHHSAVPGGLLRAALEPIACT